MDGIDGRVRGAVDVWLRWLPRWQIGTARPRTRICRKCTGSPVAAAAGFGPDVPHAVQHALIGRISTIIEDAVDDYTAKNLPLLQQASAATVLLTLPVIGIALIAQKYLVAGLASGAVKG